MGCQSTLSPRWTHRSQVQIAGRESGCVCSRSLSPINNKKDFASSKTRLLWRGKLCVSVCGGATSGPVQRKQTSLFKHTQLSATLHYLSHCSAVKASECSLCFINCNFEGDKRFLDDLYRTMFNHVF